MIIREQGVPCESCYRAGEFVVRARCSRVGGISVARRYHSCEGNIMGGRGQGLALGFSSGVNPKPQSTGSDTWRTHIWPSLATISKRLLECVKDSGSRD